MFNGRRQPLRGGTSRMIGASLPILIRLLYEMKLRVASNPGQFALAQDTLSRTIRSLEWNLVLSHLVDSPTLAGKLFHSSNMHSLTSRISSKCPIDYDTASCPSMKGHGNPFSVTIGALVSARFPPIMGWRRHDDSHFLRALCTKQHPGVSKDCLVRLVMLHRHDDIPLP